ncbi:MAG: hypothetical protein ABI147_00315 [Acidobacteriaceae bacterium]
MKRPLGLAQDVSVVREGSTGRVVAVLPRVWAVGDAAAAVETPVRESVHGAPRLMPELVEDGAAETHVRKSRNFGQFKADYGTPTLVVDAPVPKAEAETSVEQQPGLQVEVAFYRKYTEAMLRRYLRMSMEAGRVPSLLGREMFRGNVTSYRVHNFEDVVVFCLDVERCLAKLNLEEKDLVRRVALQEYTQPEAAGVLGVSLRQVSRGYGATIDKLTRMFLERRLLEPLKSCQ